MPPYHSSASSQASQASRSSSMAGGSGGNVPFRAGDWKCGAEGCGYHNFAKNVSCLRCGASRAQAALIADSTGGLSTPASMGSMGGMYSSAGPGGHHPSEGMVSSSMFNSSQYPPSQAYPPPLPSSNQGYMGGSQAYSGGSGGGGGRGPPMESGDWNCLSCGYVNFRRRNQCLRCNNFNPNLMAAQGQGGMIPHMLRTQQQQQQLPPQGQHQPPPPSSHSHAPPPHLSMLDTSLEPFTLPDEPTDKPLPGHHSRVPQSAGAIPSSSFLTRSMNNLSLGPLTSSYGGGQGYGSGSASGPLTAPPIGDDDYEFGSRSASAVDRLGGGGPGGFFSSSSGAHRHASQED